MSVDALETVGRRLNLSGQAGQSSVPLSNTLDMLNRWNSDADSGRDFDGSFNTDGNHISPHL